MMQSAETIGSGVFDQKIYDQLRKAMSDSKSTGVGYLEFSKVKKTFDNKGMSEQDKYTTAFQTMQAMAEGVTKDSVLATVDRYLGVLDNEASDFNAGMAEQTMAKVGTATAKAKQCDAAIADKQAQITKLQDEMRALQEQSANANIEAQAQQVKIDTVSKNFKATLDSLRGIIVTDKSNIQKYL